MIRPVIVGFVLLATLGIQSAQAQQAATFKRFTAFKQLVADVDFYASNRQIVTPYEKPVAETMARLKALLGEGIPKGAIFICSTLQQKDSIYEPMVLKAGYEWTLTAITSEARMQEMMERIKSQMGGELPADIMTRIRNRPPEMAAEAEKQMVVSTAQQVAYAVIQTAMDKELRFRSSRLDDMSKSPLPDWLDIGIAAYASSSQQNLSYLQQHMDQTFPLEDVIAMSRPFVASTTQGGGGAGGEGGRGGMTRTGEGNSSGMPGGMPGGTSGGMPSGGFGQGMPQGGFGGRGGTGSGMNGSGGFGGNGGQRGGGQRVIPKDEQDRMLFDGQASTLFAYIVEKLGVEKVKRLIQYVHEGKESREFLSQPDALGPDFEKLEEDWIAWVKGQKAPAQVRQGPPGTF